MGFQCAVEALDRYFKKQAKQDIKHGGFAPFAIFP
jgi:hypothetical protein